MSVSESNDDLRFNAKLPLKLSPPLGECIERAKAHAEDGHITDRLIQAQLQAPLPDAFLSWKPLTAWQVKPEHQLGILAPYIDDAFYEERLDGVLGMTGWHAHFEDKEKKTVCELTLQMPSGPITRQGVGFFQSRDRDEGNSEKGARTLAFRDACRHFGICGRDIDGAQTRPVNVRATSWKKDDKEIWTIKEVYEPLDRSILRHSGQSTYHQPAYERPTIGVATDPIARRYLSPGPELVLDRAANVRDQGGSASDGKPAATSSAGGGQKGKQSPPTGDRGDFKDITNIEWKWGKEKGKKVSELNTSYLDWCLDNMGLLQPGHEKYDEWWHNCVSYAAHVRASNKLEATGETSYEWQPVGTVTTGGEPVEDDDSIAALFNGSAV